MRLLVSFVLWYCTPAIGTNIKSDTIRLTAGNSIDFAGNSNVLQTYCYPGKFYSVLNLFETVEFQLAIANDDFFEYGGRTPEEVLEHYNEKQSLFRITLFSQKRRQIQLSPLEMECIGVVSWEPYTVSLKHVRFDLWRVAQFALGIMIICYANHLIKNSIFYYLAGIVLGICTSLLVLVAITAKFVPKRPLALGVLVGGSTIGFLVLKMMLKNIQLILLTYREYVLWYLAVTGLVSFLVCYRVGPPKNPRSQNIIKWVLQAIGAALVYFSSWHSMTCIMFLVIAFLRCYMPESVWIYIRKYFKRRFPPKRRMLTQAEYYEQSVKETSRSLAQLRNHVNSPNCRQWSIITSLNDPMRFASFANGSPHLFDEEIEDYSRTIEDSMQGMDENEAEDLMQWNMYYRPTGRHINYRSHVPGTRTK